MYRILIVEDDAGIAEAVSDKNRMADCLKIKFNATVVTNAGDAEHEKTWNASVRCFRTCIQSINGTRQNTRSF